MKKLLFISLICVIMSPLTSYAQGPIAICQNATVYLDAAGNVTINASIVDGGSTAAFGIASLSVSPSNFTCANVGANTVTLTVTDNIGNTATCTATVTVVDNIPPVAVCQNRNVYLPASGTFTMAPNGFNGGSTDNCSGLSYSPSQSTFTCADIGVSPITLTVTDSSGNAATCVATVTVHDNIAPNALCQNITIQLDAGGNASIVAADIDGGSNDNCGSVSLSASQTSFDCTDLGPNNVTLTVDDGQGQTSTCNAIVTVQDNIAPVITCPVDITVECGGDTSSATTGVATATDICGSVTISSSDFFDPTCGNTNKITRTWTATDSNGNSATCDQTITVVDTTDPVLAGIPSDVTVECNAIPVVANPTATDNCGTPTISFNETTTAGACTDTYTITRTWTATDNCGNTDVEAQTITVQDNTDPVLAGVPGDTTVQCDNIPAAGSPTATDNCDTNVTITFAESNTQTNNGTCSDSAYSITRTWTATDNCGNTDVEAQTITVQDNTDPVLAGIPANVTVECDSIPAAGSPTASDNCDTNVTITFAETNTQTNNGTCSDSAYSITRTWTATDNCGNTDVEAQTITVQDNTDPVLAGIPANVTVECDSIPAAGSPTASDNCDTNVTITFAETNTQTNNGTCSDSAYSITRTWTATDNCGNTDVEAQTITVQDNTDPVLAGIPANVTVECDNIPAAGSPTATDNCDTNVTITFAETNTQTNNGSCSDNAYSITRTWTATDNCGNTDIESQTITVQDNTDPVLAGIPANVTVECDNIPAAGSPTATDNCDTNVTITFAETNTQTNNGSCSDSAYSITRTWTATDNCGNTNIESQTITVQDTTDPTLNVPVNDTVECTDSVLPANTGNATGSDNCGSATITYSDSSTQTSNGSCTDYAYVITRTWTSTDDCGNSTSGNQTINVVDTTDPSITIPGNLTVECTDSVLPANTGNATGSDNCGSATITYSDSSTQTSNGSCTDYAYVITRTWTSTDCSGNSTSGNQTINVVDTTDPTLNVPANDTVECTDSVLPANTGNATGSDNCGSATITYSDSSTQTSNGSCSDYAYVITRTWTATDCTGNSTSGNQTINVVDTTDPTLNVPANDTVECTDSVLPANTGNATGSDNCGSATITYSDSSTQTSNGSCTDYAYVITRTWTSTDDCGNSTSGNQTINVVDTTDPTLNVPANDTVECTDSVLPANTGNATGSDNCGSATITYSDSSTQTSNGSCTDYAYVITRTWTSTDDCGNSTSGNQTINVVDTTDPSITIPGNLTVECTDSVLPANTGNATGSDNCGSATITYSDSSTQTSNGSCTDYAYVITRTWTSTDCSGNSTSGNQTINVVDTTDPTLNVPANDTVECTESVLPANTGNATSSDNCGSATITYSDSSTQTSNGSCTDYAYIITRTWTATDCTGNSTSGNQTINVVDTTDPTLNVPANDNVECTDSVLPANTGNATGSDNCGSATITYSDSSTQTSNGSCSDYAYVITRTWTSTDDCGNSTSGNQTINVVDTTDPTLNVPANDTVECTDSVLPANTGNATGSDNCGSATITYSDSSTQTSNGSCTDYAYIITRTWTATDCSGNSTSGNQTINVVDSSDPSITIPGNLTVECTDSVLPANTGNATGSDNCGSATITYSDSSTQTSNGSCTDYAYVITRTWTSTDCSGNSTSGNQTINVVDTTDPSITIPGNLTVECTDSILPANTGFALSSDYCDASPTITYSDSSTQTSNGSCSDYTYIITRTWTATDCSGNSTSGNQIITVEDSTPPAFSNGGFDLTVECGDPANLTDWLNGNGGAQAADTCGTFTWSNDFTSLSDDCGPTGSATVTFTATDECGNSSQTVLYFQILDTLNPVITTSASDLTVECDGSGNTTDLNNWLTSNGGGATATDICSNITWTNDFTSLSDLCGATGSATVTFSASDDCGNSSTTTATITIDDTIDPTASNASALNIQCFSDIPAANVNVITDETDACSTPTVTFASESDNGGNGSISNPYILTRIYDVSDACGNSISVNHVITVEDNVAPTITCPSNISQTTDTGQCFASISISDPTATDNCTANASITFTGTRSDGDDLSDPYPVGTTTITWTATDEVNNTSTSCAQTVTVTDDEDPNAICSDLTIALDSVTGLASITASDINNNSTDNCGIASYALSQSSFDCSDRGDNTVVLTVIDINGNSSTCNATVTVTDLSDTASVTINATEITFCEQETVSFTAIPFDGGSNPTFEWYVNYTAGDSPIETGVTFTSTNVLNNGDQITVTMTSDISACPQTVTSNPLTVTVNEARDVTFNINATATEICDGESVTFSVNPSTIINGGTNPTFQWQIDGSDVTGETNSTFTTSTITNLQVVTLMVESNVLCANPVPAPSTNSFTMTVNPLPTLETIDGSVCASSQSDIDLNTLVTNAGGGTVTFHNNLTAAQNGTGAISSIVSPSTATTYYVRTELGTGCYSTATIDISIDALPTVVANTTDAVICLGESVTLTGSGATSYTWDNSVSDGVAFAPTSTQTYTVTGTDGIGCYNTDTITITVNPLPTLETIDGSVCASSQSDIDLNTLVTNAGGGNVTFYNNLTAAQNGTGAISSIVSPTTATTYYVRTELGTGCYSTATIDISIDALPTVVANATSIEICNGESVTLTGSGTMSYSWDNSVTDGVGFAPTSTQTYTVTGTDGNGCYNTDTITITVNPLPNVSANATSIEICIGESVTLTGSGSTSYTWDNSISDGVPFAPTSTQTYTVTGTDGTGCYGTDTITITVNPLPNVVANATSTEICDGESVTLTGSGATSYTWDNGVSDGVAFAPTLTQTYTVTGTDGNGCDNTAQVTVTVNLLPTVTATASETTICAGETVTLTGGGATSYSWDNGVSDGVPFAPASTQTYTVTGTDGNGCDNTAQVTVTVNPLPNVSANATSTEICIGESVTLTGSGSTSYTWDNSVSNGVAFAPTSTQTYTVTGTDGTGCYGTDTITITVNPLPNVVANATSTEICDGESVTLTGSGATSYTWDNGVSDGVAFAPTSTQTYTVTGTDANGCDNTAQVTVTVNPLPTVTATASETTICAGETVTLTGGGASSYSWDNGVSDGIAFTPASTQTYTVTGTDGNGCNNTDTITITVNPLPNVSATATSMVICEGDSVTVTGGGASTYVWDNGVFNGTAFIPTATATYTVTGTDGNRCDNTDTVTITVNPLPTLVTIDGSVCAGSQSDIDLNTLVTNAGGGTVSFHNNLTAAQNDTGAISSIVSPSTATTYYVRTELGTGCYSTATIDISIDALPPVVANTTATDICVGESVTLTGSGATSYTWDNSVSDGVAFAPASTQIYTVTGTDGNGCYNSDTITITVNPLPTISTVNGNVCVSGQTSIDLSTLVTTNGTTVTYHNSQTNADNDASPIGPTVTPSTSPTTYYVRSEFATGCYVTDTIQITIEPLPTVVANATSIEICSGDSVTLTGSGATTYTWNNGVTNGVAINPTSTQTYTVTGINGNGCENTDTITITVYPNTPATPSVVAGNPANCPVVTGLLYSVTDDPNVTNYNWTVPTGFIITSGNGTHEITVTVSASAVTGDIEVTASNPCGTSALSSLEITIGDGAIATAGADQYICEGTTSITLDGFVGGAIVPRRKNVWWWDDNGAGGVVPSGGLNQTPNLTGDYILPSGASAGDTITISIQTIDPGGVCGSAYDEMQIFILPNTTISNPGNKDQTICINNAIAPISFTITDGTGATVTGLPAGVTGNYSGGVYTISGTPTESGTFNYTVTTTGDCVSASQTGTITVNPDATISAPSNNDQTVCINISITDIDYTIGGGGTGATITGLPNGLTFNSGTYTISGSPTETGVFNYTVTTTGTCQQTNATGTITVNPDTTISAPTNNIQTVCINTSITDIDYTIGGGGTGATITGLPNGLTFNSGTYTISGSPTETGTFNYTVTTTGTCVQASQTGTITVNPDATISAPTNNVQTVCINTSITDIDYTIGGGGTGATITGLPNGLTFNSGTYTISGSPTETGTFNYTVTTTGICVQTSQTGTITINPDATISAPTNNVQTLCINTSITDIDYTIGGGGTGATITGLPNGFNIQFWNIYN